VYGLDVKERRNERGVWSLKLNSCLGENPVEKMMM
jgi:hypothetical protein